MLQVARLSPKQLSDSVPLVTGFLRQQLNDDGGFRDRAGNSDLYYTVFGLEGLLAVQSPLPVSQTADYLRTFGSGESLDFVHLCCLARCWADLPCDVAAPPHREILQRIEAHRTSDGGYGTVADAEHGSLYGCFLALGAYQDLGSEMPRMRDMLGCIQGLRTEDGGYTNQPDLPLGLTPATAAAVTLLRHLGEPPPESAGEWLLARCRPEGGFFAAPQAPIPDLLSTATALHALAGMHTDFEPVKEPCLDFIDSLWTNRGGFYGNWTDDEIDCEYTYYALLALGHLSL